MFPTDFLAFMKDIADIIIIGAGACGLFTAINIAEKVPHMRIRILEKSKEALGKVRISGGGRCNLTNGETNPREFIKNYPRGNRELLGVYGGFIPGIRPGRTTVEYMNRVMTRITFVGAVFLAAVAILPTLVSTLTGLSIHFGGTSLLIAVRVALDTMKQLENQMVMRNYQGFLG